MKSDPHAPQARPHGRGAASAEPVAAFVAGTRILTDRGEIPIQDLRVGDLVASSTGVAMPIHSATTLRRIGWIGERRLVPALHDRPENVFPIRIRAGAFAPDVPQRDVLLSPGQVIVFGGARIRADELINGVTILREEAARSVRYFHIELDRYANLWAAGLACESYVEAGDRGFFATAQGTPVSYPRGRSSGRSGHIGAGSRRRRLDNEHVAQTLLDRVAALGMVALEDTDLRLVADGVMLRPNWTDGGAYGFWLKQPATNLRLISTSGRRAACDERGRYGIAVSRICHRSFDVTAAPMILDLDVLEGWARDAGPHDAERDQADERVWRWMDGAAQLPDLGAGELVIET